MIRMLAAFMAFVIFTVVRISAQSFDSGASTYAVVVGISNYQDKDIPDLRFADRDAEAFANFLRSPAGGSLDGDHLKVLTNEKATGARIGIALDWLMEVAQNGDNVIIYFSGHGDVEAKRLSQPGYLLGWDAPSRVYMTGGTVNVRDLQDIVSTLSVTNKAKVVVITDACHAGKLSGNDINGTQLTSANLAVQTANEIKILSCQAEEVSIEGEQWGGGRGVFSFNLVDALYGLADANSDLSVTLKEVGRYLEDHVTAEVAPVSQNPKVIGSPNERMASVDPKLLADLRLGRTNQMTMLSPIETRGMEEDVLAGVDTTSRELYRLFKQALKDKVFLDPEGACADAYYERLIAEPKMARLHSTMTRNYAAALQDDAQQTMNKWLRTSEEGPREQWALPTRDEKKRRKASEQKIMLYPRCLDRAAELLGSKHYMYSVLKARKYFFDGYISARLNNNPTRELGERALAMFRQSLKWQPEQPHVYWQMSQVFGLNFQDPDSMVHYAQRALEVHPKWATPILDAAGLFSYKFYQFERAQTLLEQATQIDSSNFAVWFRWAFLYAQLNENLKAELAYKKALQFDSTNSAAYINLGVIYLNAGRYKEAEDANRRAINFDSTHARFYTNLGVVLARTNRFVEAEAAFDKALQLDSNAAYIYQGLAALYEATRRYEEADAAFNKFYTPDTSRTDIIRGFLSLSPDTHLLLTSHHGIYKGHGTDPANLTWTKVLGADVNNGGNYGWHIIHKDSILLAGIDFMKGGKRGIYRSTDGGNTWTNTLHRTVLCFFDDGNVLYAGVDYQGVYRSYDLGKTWSAANNGLPLDSPFDFVRGGNNLVVSFINGEIYISSDHGDSWSRVAKASGTIYCMENVAGILFAGAANSLLISTDNGLTWNHVNDNLFSQTAVTALYAAGDTLYIGTGSMGMFVTVDGGNTFQPFNKGVGDNLFVSCITQLNGKLLVGLNQGIKGGYYFYNPASLGHMLWQYDGKNFQPVTMNFHW